MPIDDDDDDDDQFAQVALENKLVRLILFVPVNIHILVLIVNDSQANYTGVIS
jgi:hypothetical protein